jgi:glycosyltransferase involved in cell wall biosynthesis
MKLLSVVVPSYNSQAYLDACIKSLLVGGEAVEILIVDDGSKDRTGAMADEYAARFPTQVRALHQENGGHGEAVNTGIKNATGLYLKVVDSDDWVDPDAYRELLATLGRFVETKQTVDLVVSNFVYEKVGAKHKKVMHYRGKLPKNKIVGWEKVRPFGLGTYLMMHSLLYRTQVLRDSGLVLPKHTFYVDNLFVYVPLDFVKTLYYLDVDFYRYFVGRDDQSVNEAVMIKRIDQQIKVNKLVIAHQNLAQVEPRALRELKFHQLEIITGVSNILMLRFWSPENEAKRAALWDFIRQTDEALFRRMRRALFGRMAHVKARWGQRLIVGVYFVTQKMFGFN